MLTKIIILISLFFLAFIIFVSVYRVIELYNSSIKSLFTEKILILPKSFFASLILVPMTGGWLFFINAMIKINADDSYLIIFCCIFIPFFHWWIIKNIGD